MSDGYSDIDPVLKQWAQDHSVHFFDRFVGREVRCAYISSLSGECYQMWVSPERETICVHAVCVEGGREKLDPVRWYGDVSEFAVLLDKALEAILEWMKPSERFLPEPSTRAPGSLRH